MSDLQIAGAAFLAMLAAAVVLYLVRKRCPLCNGTANLVRSGYGFTNYICTHCGHSWSEATEAYAKRTANRQPPER